MPCLSNPRSAIGLRAFLLLAFTLSLGCAKVVANDGGGGSAGSGSQTGTGGGGGRRGTGGGGVIPDSGANGDGACQQTTYSFVPKVPNVLVLVDGSGSMFEVTAALPNGRWGALRSALLPVIQNLQGQVNFGLGIFSGVIAENLCPLFQTVAMGPNNYAAISAMYPATRLRPQNVALETPLTESLPMIPPLFAAAPKTGASYILFATDGEPDFCDNDNAVCPVDAAVAGLKRLFTENNITTYIMGLASDLNAGTCPGVLKGFAAAGQNQPIANPCGTHLPSQECEGRKPWTDLRTALGRTGQTSLVDYVATGSTTKVFEPNVADQASLTDTLAAAFSGVKACTFDLGAAGVRVDTTQLTKAHIYLCDSLTNNVCNGPREIALDSAQGWRVNCVPAGDPACKNTQLELTGQSCVDWRKPENDDIKFDFPCEVIIPG
jgi:hypothetical protein